MNTKMAAYIMILNLCAVSAMALERQPRPEVEIPWEEK